MISNDALRPGSPVTPPPGWAPEPHSLRSVRQLAGTFADAIKQAAE
mgnify:CR=1 FL=1